MILRYFILIHHLMVVTDLLVTYYEFLNVIYIWKNAIEEYQIEILMHFFYILKEICSTVCSPLCNTSLMC